MNQEIVEYKPIEAAIADIQRFKGIVIDVNTPDGLAEGKAVQRQVAAVRIALDKSRKKLKEDVLERGRNIDGQAKPLFARVAEIEDPIAAQIEAYTKREERERAAKVQAELERLAAEEKARKDAEEARMAAERAEIARQRAELEAQQKAERDRLESARIQQEGIERAARAKIEEAERASRAAIEAQEREARLAREQADREAKALREAEEARLKAERDKIEAERRAVEDAQRKEREAAEAKATAERQAKEAEQRRIQQQQNDILDGRAMLTAFNTRFGHLAEFKVIADLIDDFLAERERKAA